LDECLLIGRLAPLKVRDSWHRNLAAAILPACPVIAAAAIRRPALLEVSTIWTAMVESSAKKFDMLAMNSAKSWLGRFGPTFEEVV
jgi:hypothetical protein